MDASANRSGNQEPAVSSEGLYRVTRPRAVLLRTIDAHAHAAKNAADSNNPRECHPIPSIIPPSNGPAIDPSRPTPKAQPTPVDRIEVG
jgi:hypothetical protein